MAIFDDYCVRFMGTIRHGALGDMPLHLSIRHSKPRRYMDKLSNDIQTLLYIKTIHQPYRGKSVYWKHDLDLKVSMN